MGRRSALKKANWEQWAQMPHTDLWKVVALSCDFEPMSIPAEVQRADIEDFGGAAKLPAEYTRRRKIADAHAQAGGSLSLRERRHDIAESTVDLAEFRRFAESFQPPWELPEQFPRAATARRGSDTADHLHHLPPSPHGPVTAAAADASVARTVAGADAGPSLTTDDVCDGFDGIGMTSLQWRATLSKSRPNWVMECRDQAGRQGNGGRQATWFILKLASALLDGRARCRVTPDELDATFRRHDALKAHSKLWRAIRDDHPLWGD